MVRLATPGCAKSPIVVVESSQKGNSSGWGMCFCVIRFILTRLIRV